MLNQNAMIGRFQHVSISHISDYMSQHYVANIYKKDPGCLGEIGDYTQLCGDNNPL